MRARTGVAPWFHLSFAASLPRSASTLCRLWHRGVSFYPRLYLIVRLAFELASLDIRSSYIRHRALRSEDFGIFRRESIESRNRKGATGVLRVAEELREPSENIAFDA